VSDSEAGWWAQCGLAGRRGRFSGERLIGKIAGGLPVRLSVSQVEAQRAERPGHARRWWRIAAGVRTLSGRLLGPAWRRFLSRSTRHRRDGGVLGVDALGEGRAWPLVAALRPGIGNARSVPPAGAGGPQYNASV
jgi:hypothetical protein